MKVITPTVIILLLVLGCAPAFDTAAKLGDDAWEPYRKACSATQLSVVEKAIKEARALTSSASKTFPISNSSAAARFKRWFGGTDGETGQDVAAIYAKIDGKFLFNAYWCPNQSVPGSDPNTLAFVPPDSTSEMFFQAGFFTLPDTGADSKAGSILHEASHLLDTPNIEDFRYGTAKALQLAKDAPSGARLNADTFQYYAEDVKYVIP
jgi:peptidyl-Lys metalloendopeptidase